MHRYGILVLALCLWFLVATRVAAEPRLTDREQYCAFLGTIAHAITVDRNAEVPLTTTLAQLREIVGGSYFEGMAMVIYGDVGRQVSPEQVRQASEVGCLSKTPEQPAPSPVTRKKGRIS